MRNEGGGAIITAEASALRDWRERAHGSQTRRRSPDDNRIAGHVGNRAPDDAQRFLGLQLRRLTHDTEHRGAISTDTVAIGEQPVDGCSVDGAVGQKRRGADRGNARCVGGESHNLVRSKNQMDAMSMASVLRNPNATGVPTRNAAISSEASTSAANSAPR